MAIQSSERKRKTSVASMDLLVDMTHAVPGGDGGKSSQEKPRFCLWKNEEEYNGLPKGKHVEESLRELLTKNIHKICPSSFI